MKLLDPEEHPSNLYVALFGSFGVNVVLWCALGQGSNQPVAIVKPPELIFDRVTMEPNPKHTKPVFHPIQPKKRPPVVPPKHEVAKQHQPPPEGAHNRIIAAPAPKAPPSHEDFVVKAGGNAPVGVPTDHQNAGNGTVNPPVTPPVQPPVTPPSPPVQPTSPVKHDEAPPPPPVKHEEPPAPPPPPPKPKGESREAKPDHQESVDIPEGLKSQSFKSFVRVRVTIESDGKFNVLLRTSSGNPDVDKLVLDTLKKWTWKPALKDGDAVESVQQFRFDFSIQ